MDGHPTNQDRSAEERVPTASGCCGGGHAAHPADASPAEKTLAKPTAGKVAEKPAGSGCCCGHG